jgi:hypothetical protein
MKHIYLTFRVLVIVLAIVAFNFSQAQTTLTKWTFDNEDLVPAIGEGTATNIGGTSFTWANGVDGRAWNTSTYPDQSAGSGTAGVEFMVSTQGFQKISIAFQQRSSGTGSRWAEIHYTTNGGTNWNLLANNAGGLSPHDTFYPFTFDLSTIPDADNNQNFGFRVVSVFSPVAFEDGLGNSFNANEAYHRSRVEAGSPYGPAGTWRFDDVEVMAMEPVGIREQAGQNWTAFVRNNQLVINGLKSVNAQLDVLNILGQVVLQEQISDNISNVSLTGLQGVYFVRITNDSGNSGTRKIYIP